MSQLLDALATAAAACVVVGGAMTAGYVLHNDTSPKLMTNQVFRDAITQQQCRLAPTPEPTP